MAANNSCAIAHSMNFEKKKKKKKKILTEIVGVTIYHHFIENGLAIKFRIEDVKNLQTFRIHLMLDS